MRAEGLNLSPLFQIILCPAVSSEISHYLSFKVSVQHKICCPPALPALGLALSCHTVIPTVPDNKTVLPSTWALSETPAHSSHSVSHTSWVSLPPHLDMQSHHSSSVLIQAVPVFTKTNCAFGKRGYLLHPAQAPHSCFVVMSLSAGKSQNVNFNLGSYETSICILSILFAFKEESYLLKCMKNTGSKFNLKIIFTSFSGAANLDNFESTVKFRILTSAVLWVQNYIV